jgi:dTDP-4-amino-4,6-dideoxygalactose transaminase
VPFCKISFDEREIDQIAYVIRGGHLTQGKETQILEKEFSSYVGSKYAIAVDSCTNALFLSLKYSNVGSEDVVTIPSVTFASVANVILQAGATLDFEDEVYVGHPYYLKSNRPVKIVDSAHAIERGIYRDFDRSLMCFSFYPTKQIGSCEGGMICTNDYYAMEWLSSARMHGRHGAGYVYDIKFPGYKMNMTDVQAAMVRIQLSKLDTMNLRRKEIVNYYNEQLKEAVTSRHLYSIEMDDRDEFIKYMHQQGINCSVHFYTPLHQQTAYKRFNSKALPKSETFSKRTVSLPFYYGMEQEDLDYVIDAVKAWRLNGSEKSR